MYAWVINLFSLFLHVFCFVLFSYKMRWRTWGWGREDSEPSSCLIRFKMYHYNSVIGCFVEKLWDGDWSVCLKFKVGTIFWVACLRWAEIQSWYLFIHCSYSMKTACAFWGKEYMSDMFLVWSSQIVKDEYKLVMGALVLYLVSLGTIMTGLKFAMYVSVEIYYTSWETGDQLAKSIWTKRSIR